MNPDDTAALASAVSHAETLWQVDLPALVAEHLEASITVKSDPLEPEMKDILPNSLEFDSVQGMNLCTRYWILRIVLCGLASTLYRHFPAETSLSLLPSPQIIRAIDVESAIQMAKSLPWALAVSRKLPLVPLRLHSALQVSIGPWHRIIRDPTLASFGDSIETNLDPDFEVSRARRMKTWLFYQCNCIHKPWNVSEVEEQPLLEALDAMTGEEIPEWLPVRVRFEAEDGEMVIKLDYENREGKYQEKYEMGEKLPQKKLDPTTQDGRWPVENASEQGLPFRPANNASTAGLSTNKNSNVTLPQSRTTTVRPVDFIHSTGRNLCSTSGWWPDTPNTTTIPLDSTDDASGFLPPDRTQNTFGPALPFENNDNHPCLASSWWPQTPTTVTHFSSLSPTPKTVSTSPTWSAVSPESGTTDDSQNKVDRLSSPWHVNN